MGRYTGPKVRLSRREGQDLLLKGAKTYSEKNPTKTKPQPPGQHGFSRKRLSDFGLQLREKQKIKRIYGLFERQFKNYFNKASSMEGITGENFLSLLERRLDNFIYRLGISVTRAQARKWVNQGKFLVNGTSTNVPSFLLSKGDVVTFIEEFEPLISEEYEIPLWINWDNKKKRAEVKSLPVRSDIKEVMNEQLVIDYYSR